MNFDFSELNLHYLIQARDMARRHPTQVTVWLGLSPDLVQQLADLTPEQLARVPRLKRPLVKLRQESWWWERFFNALREDRSDEIQAIVEHLNLLTAHEPGEAS